MFDFLMQIAAVAAFAAKINASSWKDTLPIMGIGMAGIFIVIGAIILATYLLNKAFSSKKKDGENNKEN